MSFKRYMKVYKNQNEQNARQIGLWANFSLAENAYQIKMKRRRWWRKIWDWVTRKQYTAIDEIGVRRSGEDHPYEYEVAEYDPKTKTCRISIMSPSENKKYHEQKQILGQNGRHP